jgi:hypothetical protein
VFLKLEHISKLPEALVKDTDGLLGSSPRGCESEGGGRAEDLQFYGALRVLMALV